MKISVILTIYNGEKYIIEQLDSLRRQEKQPNEVLIYDDCSTDKSCEIINSYIKEHKLNDWNFYVNKEQKGWKKNFWDGIKSCSGDLIFPCDQDDIWNKDKILVMSEIMQKNSSIEVLASNYNAFYEDGAIQLTKKVSIQENNGTLQKVVFDEKFMYTFRPGCTYVIRNTFFEDIKKYWRDDPHDAFLWRYAIINEGLYVVNTALINFRRHSNNASSPYIDRNLNKSIDIVKHELCSISRLKEYSKDNLHSKYMQMLLTFEKFLKLRLRLFESRNFVIWLHLIIKYNKYYLTFRSILGDLYVVIKK